MVLASHVGRERFAFVGWHSRYALCARGAEMVASRGNGSGIPAVAPPNAVDTGAGRLDPGCRRTEPDVMADAARSWARRSRRGDRGINFGWPGKEVVPQGQQRSALMRDVPLATTS